MSEELYPEHKAQAIIEFTYTRLRSYYVNKKDVLIPAARMYKRAEAMLAASQPEASLVFSASAIELFLKACLLRPVVAGLVHSETLAELVVDASLSQTGYRRYEKLLAWLYRSLLGTEIKTLRREGSAKPLLEEAAALHERRNAIIHRGAEATTAEAEEAFAVARSIFELILAPVLSELGMAIEKGGKLMDNEI
ncbi:MULTISPECIES: hypothetical protein [unclassified Rubrivivax]|uniref:hypothetical protein n=1 Tax=unclassified Rubrivivax TaxID=2649762 RepID=UPI001E2EF325|nr:MULTISPECIES: hypothetical protein [unclassified Rubrivivax]MCC9596984.1 hypothetical protein [Rubrivivax sp. JA1055]MCC9649139.1 hypothetical protein [Rubrivivax sp. JA1029]